MDNLVVMALVVSGVGMLLLFAALAFLYGLIYLLTAVLRDPSPAPAPVAEGSRPDRVERKVTWRAAAAAVALARAEREFRSSHAPAAQGGAVSPWWALHQGRQLMPKPGKRRGG
jgi:Na+-transporting methylmalonyl-CoA/oxaloacetate decarboxylase gamma subunit